MLFSVFIGFITTAKFVYEFPNLIPPPGAEILSQKLQTQIFCDKHILFELL